MSLGDLIKRIRGESVTTGIDVGHFAIKLSRIEHSNGAMHLISADMEKLPMGTITDGVIKDEAALVGALDKITGRNFPSGIHGDVVISINWSLGILADRMVLRKQNQQDNEAFIIDEATKRSPFDEPDVNLDYEILNDREQNEQEVLIVAAKESILTGWARRFVERGLRPVAMDVDAFAVANVYLAGHSEEEQLKTVGILSIGDRKSHITFVKAGLYHSTREVGNASVSDFLSGICRRLGMNMDIAAQILRGEKDDGYDKDMYQAALEVAAEDFSTQVNLAMRYFTSQEGNQQIDELILTGGGASIPGLQDFLKVKLEVETSFLNPLTNGKIKYDEDMFGGDGLSQEIVNLLTTSLGLALRKF